MSEVGAFLVALCAVTGLAFGIAGVAFLSTTAWFVGVGCLLAAVMCGWLASLIVRAVREES